MSLDLCTKIAFKATLGADAVCVVRFMHKKELHLYLCRFASGNKKQNQKNTQTKENNNNGCFSSFPDAIIPSSFGENGKNEKYEFEIP